MAGGLLPEIERGELKPKGADAADDVHQQTVGKLLVAAGDERRVHDLQRAGQVLDLEERRRDPPGGAGRDHEREGPGVPAGSQPLQLAVCPLDCCTQACDQIINNHLVGLRSPLLVRERCDRRGALLHREVQAQRIQLLQVQKGCLAPLRRHDLARHVCRHVRVAIAVATHPGREDDRRGVQRQGLPAPRSNDGVEAAQEAWHCVPERRLDNCQALAGLLLWGRLAAAKDVGSPHCRHRTLDSALILHLLIRCLVRALLHGLTRGQQLCHMAVF
mmetsp:Transcript_104728/g.333145  ORF Transcript_104728/g.333145 Transcript_104728/m.333145 type:complete len:274 (+) Transcript_104728:1527-2348(+)